MSHKISYANNTYEDYIQISNTNIECKHHM